MKKVIILYSTAGMGHKKAALALEKVFKEKAEGRYETKAVDVMDSAGRLYKFLYLNFYVFLMSRAKWLWGFMYYASNSVLFDIATRKIRGFLDYKGLPKVGKLLLREKADAVIATHFILPSIAGILKKKKYFKSKLFTVITDYGPHTYWLSDYIDVFFTGSESTTEKLALRGVAEERIVSSGIPAMEEFNMQFDIDSLRKKYDLDKDKRTVFLMTGGFGVGPMGEILTELEKSKTNIQVIVVCGHNEELYKKLEQVRSKLTYPVVLFGFTDRVAELMAVSDLMVTKAGGISVTEAMNSRLPMILYGSVPGQETWNEELLVTSGAAILAKSIKEIPARVDKILGSRQSYQSFQEGLDRVRRPYAAEKVVEVVLKEIGI